MLMTTKRRTCRLLFLIAMIIRIVYGTLTLLPRLGFCAILGFVLPPDGLGSSVGNMVDGLHDFLGIE
jgi:hypothetical protein